MENTELQQALQRHVSQFAERVTQAMEPLERSSRADVSDTALKRNLLYASSAIDIATGPFPEVNLLDMLVFVRLSLKVLDEHWLPKVYGDEGREVASAFQKSEEELWELAANVMDEPRRRELKDLIDQWRSDNLDLVRVEGIRLSDFSGRAEQAARERAERAKGLLSSIKSATGAADQALLLAERAMFLIHRMPFLVRLQARLAAREIIADTSSRLLLGPNALVPSAAENVKARIVKSLSPMTLVNRVWALCRGADSQAGR